MNAEHTQGPERYRLSEADNELIFLRDIAPIEFVGIEPSSTPEAHFFGGQPGAGKSLLQASVIDRLAERDGVLSVMPIIGDELRPFHPQFGTLLADNDETAAFYTDLDSGRWIERSIGLALERRPNVLLEGTLRDPRVTTRSAEAFVEAGFGTHLHVVAVNEFVSRTRIFGRYLGQIMEQGHGRYTLPDAHHRAYQTLPASLVTLQTSGLFDTVTLCDLGGRTLETVRRGEDPDGYLLATALARERDPITVDFGSLVAALRSYEEGAAHLGRQGVLADIRRCMAEITAVMDGSD